MECKHWLKLNATLKDPLHLKKLMSYCNCETSINQFMDFKELLNSDFRNLFIIRKMLLGHHMNRKQDIEYWIWNDRYDPFEQDSEKFIGNLMQSRKA